MRLDVKDETWEAIWFDKASPGHANGVLGDPMFF